LLATFPAVDDGEGLYTVICRREVSREIDPGHKRVELLTQDLSTSSPIKRVWWEQLRLPSSLGAKFDVLLSPANVGVLAARIPQVLVFQNMAPFDARVRRTSRLQGRVRLEGLRLMGIASARVARRVVFISDYARESIARQAGLAADKTVRVYLGRDPAFAPTPRERIDGVLQRYRLTTPYVLSVSHFYHYKNIVELVRAFALARTGLGSRVTLAIAGAEHEHDYAAAVRRSIADAGIDDCVRLLGPVGSADLPALYAGATLFVFPSTCESFPNILVEGMASGAPTLSSREGPMPEIAGSGAAYFDPFDPSDIAATIVRVWKDGDEAKRLRSSALARVRDFSWERTAQGLLDALRCATSFGRE